MPNDVSFIVAFDRQDEEEANALASKIQSEHGDDGVTAEIQENAGFLPLLVLLAIVVPPGIALLTVTISRVIERWKRHGVLIDARGPKVVVQDLPGTPFGTVAIVTGKDEKFERSDISEEDLSKYIGAAVSALTGGASGDEAKKAADEATK